MVAAVFDARRFAKRPPSRQKVNVVHALGVVRSHSTLLICRDKDLRTRPCLISLAFLHAARDIFVICSLACAVQRMFSPQMLAEILREEAGICGVQPAVSGEPILFAAASCEHAIPGKVAAALRQSVPRGRLQHVACSPPDTFRCVLRTATLAGDSAQAPPSGKNSRRSKPGGAKHRKFLHGGHRWQRIGPHTSILSLISQPE